MAAAIARVARTVLSNSVPGTSGMTFPATRSVHSSAHAAAQTMSRLLHRHLQQHLVSGRAPCAHTSCSRTQRSAGGLRTRPRMYV